MSERNTHVKPEAKHGNIRTAFSAVIYQPFDTRLYFFAGTAFLYTQGRRKEDKKSALAAYGHQMKKIRAIYSLLSAAFLLMGMCIYLFFRDLGAIALFAWMRKPLLLDTPLIPSNTDAVWGRLFVFNLPHGLWALSGLLIIRAIWLTDVKWRAVYGGIFLAIVSALEIGQLSENRHGTFDVLDLASYGVAAFVESMTYNKFVKRRAL